MKRNLVLIGYMALTAGILLGVDAFVSYLLSSERLNLAYYRAYIQVPLYYVTLAVSLNLINGITGQFSLGHAGFVCVGAYLSAGFSYYYSEGWVQNFAPSVQPMAQGAFLFMAALIGGLSAAGAGLLVGIPCLRLRGDYLAIATLGFGEIIRIIFENTQAQGERFGFGGARGFNDVPMWAGNGFFWNALLAVACVAVCRNFLKSPHGLAFLAVREDEVAAEAMGINATRYKTLAFIIGAAFAGMAGAIFAHQEGVVAPRSFSVEISIMVVAMVVLGGQGSITGAIVAGAGLTALSEALRFMPKFEAVGREFSPSDLRMVVFALVLILAMIFRQQGLFGHREIGWKSFRFRRRKPEAA